MHDQLSNLPYRVSPKAIDTRRTWMLTSRVLRRAIAVWVYIDLWVEWAQSVMLRVSVLAVRSVLTNRISHVSLMSRLLPIEALLPFFINVQVEIFMSARRWLVLLVFSLDILYVFRFTHRLIATCLPLATLYIPLIMVRHTIHGTLKSVQEVRPLLSMVYSQRSFSIGAHRVEIRHLWACGSLHWLCCWYHRWTAVVYSQVLNVRVLIYLNLVWLLRHEVGRRANHLIVHLLILSLLAQLLLELMAQVGHGSRHGRQLINLLLLRLLDYFVYLVFEVRVDALDFASADGAWPLAHHITLLCLLQADVPLRVLLQLLLISSGLQLLRHQLQGNITLLRWLQPLSEQASCALSLRIDRGRQSKYCRRAVINWGAVFL